MSAGSTINRRILVIDDNEAIHEDFRKILSRGPRNDSLDAIARLMLETELEPGSDVEPLPEYDIESALQGEEGVQKVCDALARECPYAMAFVDMRMPPGLDGVQTIERLWQQDDEVNVVICTAYSDYSWDDIYRTFGHTDRLLLLRKPYDNAEVRQLAAALTAKWSHARQANLKKKQLEEMVEKRTAELRLAIEELESTKAQLERMSTHLASLNTDLCAESRNDALTTLLNRRGIDDALPVVDDLTDERGGTYGVIMIDVDHFKCFNDTAGHQAGDACLRQVADALKSTCRGSDLVGRYGGEEFIVAAASVDLAQTTDLASRIIDAVRALAIAHPGLGDDGVVTVSAGVAVGRPGEIDRTVLRADQALYRAKSEGRGRVCVHGPGDAAAA